jgi:putative membrane protein
MITLFFTSEASEKKIIFASAIIFLALYPVNYIYSFQAPHRFLAYVLTVFTGIFLGYTFIKFLDRDFGIFNTKNLLKSFILFWLTSKPEYFEKELEKAGISQRGWTKCLSIGDVKLISTSFHPGPMRNVGGATLVPEILDRFENSMYLHGASKHENNPVSRREVEKILSSISCSGSELKVFRPFELKGRKFELKVFPFNNVKLLIFSGKEAIDDIPLLLNQTAESYLGEVMLVDAHNAHKENFDISAEDFFELEELIRGAATIETQECNLQYFFFKKELNAENLMYAAILFLKYPEKMHAILMLDGNNIIKEFRDELERFGRDKGVEISVITTDNHSKTGISPKIGYRPIGSADDRRKVYLFLQEAFDRLEFRSAYPFYSKNELIVRIMGKEFFGRVEKAFKMLGEKSLGLLALVVLTQLLIATLLGTRIL